MLTRLPGDARIAPADATRLLKHRFGKPLLPSASLMGSLIPRIAEAGIAGGACYDAFIAATSVEHGGVLLTRDTRAEATYLRLDAAREFVPDDDT